MTDRLRKLLDSVVSRAVTWHDEVGRKLPKRPKGALDTRIAGLAQTDPRAMPSFSALIASAGPWPESKIIRWSAISIHAAKPCSAPSTEVRLVTLLRNTARCQV